MTVEPDWSSARSALRTIKRHLLTVVVALYASCRAFARRTTTATREIGRWLHSTAADGHARTGDLVESEPTRRLVRRLSRGLVGVRRDVSALTFVVAPVLAVVSARWVARSYGYRRVQSWAVGTWTGADPHLFVFVGVAVLIGVATTFTVANSGLVPATVLVMGPLFGVGFTRYGITVAHHGPVGIPEAVASGGFVALAFGVPIGLIGFLVGTALRKGAAHFGGSRGLDRGHWEA